MGEILYCGLVEYTKTSNPSSSYILTSSDIFLKRDIDWESEIVLVNSSSSLDTYYSNGYMESYSNEVYGRSGSFLFSSEGSTRIYALGNSSNVMPVNFTLNTSSFKMTLSYNSDYETEKSPTIVIAIPRTDV